MTKRLNPILLLVLALVPASLWTAVASADPPPHKAHQANPKQTPLNVFEGRILHPEDGKPVAGATIAVADAESGFIGYAGDQSIYTTGPDEKFMLFFTKRNGRAAATTKTDAEGRFAIKGLKPGSYNVMAVHKKHGFAIKAEVKQPNEENPLELTLQAPATIRGSLQGLKLGQAWPMLEGRSEVPRVGLNVFPQIDKNGKFDLGAIPPVTWDFSVSQTVQKQGYNATLLKAAIETRPGKPSELNLDLTSGEKFQGVVRGPKGKPLFGVSVVATTVDNPQLSIGAVTDKSGEYTIRGLPAGDYTLEAKRWTIRTAPG